MLKYNDITTSIDWYTRSFGSFDNSEDSPNGYLHVGFIAGWASDGTSPVVSRLYYGYQFHSPVGLPKYKHNDITVKATGGWGINSGTYLRSTIPGFGSDTRNWGWLVHADESYGYTTYYGQAYAGGFA